MSRQFLKINSIIVKTIILFLFIGNFSLLNAKDTDIYKINTKQNCYILLDNSGSMSFGVYEQNVDYGAMFDYLFILNDSAPGSYSDYIYDTINDSDDFYGNHEEQKKIFLWLGKMGLTIANVNGENVTFTGDAADPTYLWYSNDLVDTHTMIDANGDLTSDSSGYPQMLTVDTDGHILYSGHILPLDKDIKLHDKQTLYNGTQMDIGFGGLLNAPGYYFSGYGKSEKNGKPYGNARTGKNGDKYLYFFVTGNWVNMQAMYNLHYTTNNSNPPDSSADSSGKVPAWKYEFYPQSASDWMVLFDNLKYPQTGNYENDLEENDSLQKIVHPGATQMQVHFSAFDVKDGDSVIIKDGTGQIDGQYDNNNNPTSGDGWSNTIAGQKVVIILESDDSDNGMGYTIDKIRVTYHFGSYLMQDRMDVAKDAVLYTIDAFKGKMNWGYASFHYDGTSGDGAQLRAVLNPTETDDAHRQAIITAVNNETPKYGTPLGEALQDIFEKGYRTSGESLNNLSCRKNYIISVTDGFPSDDDDWTRILNKNSEPSLTFQDWDNDGWTEDPSQYSSPPPDYYDDVGHWMYTHSWKDDNKIAINDPANSYDNIITHDIAFGANQPFLKNAASESGGKYIVAYNKEQLVSAFYSLGLQMTDAVSFTSPVVSIDAANKIQNGDDLYLGLFLPHDKQPWTGNLKKFQFGDGSSSKPDAWMIYDGKNNPAINSSGEFLDNTAGFWDDDNDPNDSDDYGSADVKEDGVGSVLTKRVVSDFSNGKYWERSIYTYNSTLESLVKIQWDSITASDLGVTDELTRDKTINFLYGYTYDTNSVHQPVAVRDWALGAIVHSKPVVIDYYSDDLTSLQNRYIIVGANDGMLHVFDDTSSSSTNYGKEIFAFVPEDILPKLNEMAQNPFIDTVDGQITLYRLNQKPKYLIFGERRGGKYFWCLDISNPDTSKWKVVWKYTNNEIAQSWSDLTTATIPVSVNANTGEKTFKDVLVFTAGYDSIEDNFPEPFEDNDHNGTPYKIGTNGTNAIDTNQWKKNNGEQDVNNNGDYDLYNPDKDSHGRGLYVVDIDDPVNVITDSSDNQVLPFSVTYGDTESTDGAVQTLPSMKFCFPASPSVITASYSYLYQNDSGEQVADRISNVLDSIYVIDIYSNVYRITYSLKDNQIPLWKVTLIFSGNLERDDSSLTSEDRGTKTFYPPTISWGGSCSYFDAGNYSFSNTIFLGTDKIATLFFGTGDREHPKYKIIRNRFYAIYDDSSVTATIDKNDPLTPDNLFDDEDVIVSSVPYTEVNLLDLTCDQLDLEPDTPFSDTKNIIREKLIDDATYYNTSTNLLDLENGVNEDDAKGWYIILEDQGDCNTGTAGDHHGEKILSSVSLYTNILYFTSYQPTMENPCNPHGNGFEYAIKYCDGSSAYNLNPDNGQILDVSDRAIKITNILGVPSNFAIITRQGGAGAMSMMGENIVGPQGGSTFKIISPPKGLIFYYWYQGNSQQQ